MVRAAVAVLALSSCLATCPLTLVAEGTPDAGADAGAAGVACGSLRCAAGSAACCVRPSPAPETCEPLDGGCPLGAGKFQCDGPEDCAAGQSCCGYSGRVGSFCGGASCFAEVLCHTAADCPTSQANCCAAGNAYRSCGASACP
jgi:hypothetical protein